MDKGFYYFGLFRVEIATRTVLRDRAVVELTEKEFDLLLLLVGNRGTILSKESLNESLWPNRIVEESNLGQHIKALRKKLDDEGRDESYIRTAHRRGYYFAATVTDTPPASAVFEPQVAQSDNNAGPSESLQDNSAASESTIPRKTLFSRLAVRFGLPAAVLILFATLGIRWGVRTRAIHPRPAIAVFGFKNSTAQPTAAWLSTALSEMFRTELMAGVNVRMVPGEDVERARAELALPAIDTLGKDSLARIRGNLNADYVLLGSYIQIGSGTSGQIRLDIKLQDTATGEVAASVSESGAAATLFELVSQSTAVLSTKLRGGYMPTDITHDVLSRNPEATRLYAEGLKHLRLYDAITASRLLKEATENDPNSALIHSALAEAWSTLGYRYKAEGEAKKAVDLGAHLPREAGLAIQARYHEILRDWDQAVQIYQSLWTVFSDNPEHALHLANALTSAHRGSAALATLKELRQKVSHFDDDPRVDLAEAVAAESLGDSKGELAAAERAIAKAGPLGARLLVAQAQLRACWALDNLSRWDEALTFARSARQIFAEFGDRASEAHAVKNIGDVFDDRGEHAEAKRIYEEAVAVYRDIGHQDGLAATLNNLGEALRSLGDLDSAKRSYEESAKLAAVTGDWKLEAIVLNGIGSILWRRGNLAGAQEVYEKAVAGLRKAGDKDLLANSILNLAEVLQDQGYLDDGLKLFEESLVLADRPGNKSSTARILGDIGELLLAKGDLLGAKKRFNDQLALGGKIPDDKQSAYALQGLGQIHLAQGELREARSKYEEALKLRAELTEKGLVAETRLALAELEMEENRPSNATTDATEAANQFRIENEVGQEALADGLLARSLAADGHASQSANSATRASVLLPKVESVALRLSILTALARVKAGQGKLAQASTDLRGILNEAYKLRSVPRQLEVQWVLCEFDPQSCTPALENEARDKGFLLIANKVATMRSKSSSPQR